MTSNMGINQGLRIKWNGQDIDKIKIDLDKLLKELQTNANKNPIQLGYIDMAEVKKQLDELEKQFKKTSEKLPSLTKTALKNAEKGDMYAQVKKELNLIEQEIKKIGGTISDVFIKQNSKTGAITNATITYADSLGKVKSELYQIKNIYETIDGKKKITGVELENTDTTYRNNIGSQQSKNFSDAKKELSSIQKIQKELLNIDDKKSDLYKTLNTQLKAHESTLKDILNNDVKISQNEKESAINKQQQVELDKIRKNNAEELIRLETKKNDISNRKTSSTTSGQRTLGEEVNIGKPINFNASKTDLNEYAKAVAGVGAEWTKLTPKTDKVGNNIKEVSVRTKEGSDKWRNYTMTLDETTGKLYKVDRGLSDVGNRQIGFIARMKNAMVAVTS